MPDFPVTLGSFAFQGFEVPSEMPFGGAQALTMHKLIGGGRVIDAMGRDDDRLSWSGTFLSPDADQRARALDALRVAGAPLPLVWNTHRYQVVIQSFSPIYRRVSEVPYKIVCVVIQDQTQPLAATPLSPDADFTGGLTDAGAAAAAGSASPVAGGFAAAMQGATQAARTAIGTVQQAASSVAAIVSPALAAIHQVIGVAGSVSGAGRPQLAQISTAIGQGQAALNPLIASQDGFLGSQAFVGGVVPGATPAANAASLLAATATGAQLPQLMQINNDLTNMTKAIGRLGT
jgi:hypothetical protein